MSTMKSHHESDALVTEMRQSARDDRDGEKEGAQSEEFPLEVPYSTEELSHEELV
jgi:hypothetical protein